MAELVFILTDFFSVADAGGHGVAAAAGLPRLPLLETILARSRAAPLDSDWRGWLACRFPGEPVGASVPAALMTDSVAGTVAAAWDASPAVGPARGQVWLATPVHYYAGIDSVYLHPAGLLRLDSREQDTLVADFGRVFAGSPWALRSIGQRELLLSGPTLAASGADPARFAGSDPSAGLPRGEGAAALRGLGAEMEMWLYEHPLNLERHSRGELPVTTLWLWGGEANLALPLPVGARTGAQPAHLYGRDTYAEALWRLQGSEARALPGSFDATPIAARTDAIFLYALLQPAGLTAALLQFEQHWLAAALRAVGRRRVSLLRLLIGRRSYSLGWLELARLWRARAPWWETLA
ncbi:MAG: hypothetical protein ACHQDB_01435 [Steroidobacterales bacterium]